MDKTTGGIISTATEVKPEFSQEEFLRDALISLSQDAKTPVDILTCNFGEVTQTKNQYLFIDANVTINYTCTIGIDRKEEYWDSSAQKYKTRTVTDWSPFNGSNKSQEKVCVKNGYDEDFIYFKDRRISITYEACSKESKFADKNCDGEISNTALQNAEKICGRNCFSKVSLPGDRHKDENYSTDMKVNDIQSVVMPEYETEYTYQDKKFKATSFACGIPFTDAQIPSVASDIKKSAKKRALPFLWGAIAAIVLFVLGFILSGAVHTAFTFVGILGMIAFIVLLVLYFVFKQKFIKSVVAEAQKIKLNELIKVLKEKGYKELSDDETKRVLEASAAYIY